MTGPIPNRRQSLTVPLTWFDGSAPHKFEVTIGFYPDGAPAEVFAIGPKEGSTMLSLLSDACILISKLRQGGLTFTEIAAALNKAGEPGFDNSPLSTIARAAADIEAEA